MRPVPWLLLALTASLCTGGCGAGGGEPDRSVTVTITSSGVIDGFVSSNGSFSSAGGGPVVGDIDCAVNGRSSMMFFHFDISGIPTSATILSATFQPYLVTHSGNPLDLLGNQIVDHVDFGGVLDAFDITTGAVLLHGHIGTAANTVAVGYRSVDATTSVTADHGGLRVYSEFSIRTSLYSSNVDSMCDYIAWEDGEGSYGTGHPPVLSVTYLP